MSGFVHLDAGETSFFLRELESIKARTYDIKFPNLMGMQIIPVSSTADTGAEFITYDQYEMTGFAKTIADYADDLPSASTKGRQFQNRVVSIGSSYQYNLQEIRAARMANKPLQQRMAMAARRAVDQKINKMAFFGEVNNGITGMFNNPDVTRVAAPENAGSTSRAWADKTPEEILSDMVEAFNSVYINTLGIERATTLLLPLSQYTLISNTRLASGTDTTIREFFLMNNPGAEIIAINECSFQSGIDIREGYGGGIGIGDVPPQSDIMVAYARQEDMLTLEIPQPFEQLPVQETNLAYKINCHARCAGTLIYYPTSITIYEGI